MFREAADFYRQTHQNLTIKIERFKTIDFITFVITVDSRLFEVPRRLEIDFELPNVWITKDFISSVMGGVLNTTRDNCFTHNDFKHILTDIEITIREKEST